MPTERLAPDALLTQTNLTGTVARIQEPVSTPDANWLTAQSNNADSVCIVSFGNPSGNPRAGAGLQNFRIRARKFDGSNNPTYAVYLLESGVRLNGGTPIATGTLTSLTGQTITAAWNASLLGTANGSAVECEFYVTKAGGSPASRATGEVGAVEWNADYQINAVTGDLAAIESAVDTASFTADVLVQGDLGATDAPDTADFTGAIIVSGGLTATDAPDTAALSGQIIVSGLLAATDAPDTASLTGAITAGAQMLWRIETPGGTTEHASPELNDITDDAIAKDYERFIDYCWYRFGVPPRTPASEAAAFDLWAVEQWQVVRGKVLDWERAERYQAVHDGPDLD